MLADRLKSLRGGSLVENIALFLVFAGVGRLVLVLEPVSGIAALVWPSSGIALAAVLLRGYGLLPAVFLGSVVVTATAKMPPLVIAMVALGNTLEVGLASYAVRRFAGYRGSFDSLRHVTGLVVAATLATLVCAMICTSGLALGGIVSTGMAWRTWRAWWLGNLLGDLIVTPLVLSWASLRGFRISPARLFEAAALGVVLVGASIAILFREDIEYPFDNPYLFFPLFIWAAHRFGLRGASTATAIVSVFAIWATIQGTGPFVQRTLARSLLALQTFLGCAALTPLFVAGAVADRAAAVRVRDEFLAVAGHELRTPLAAMLMQVESLQRALTRNPNIPVADRLAKVANSGRRLERLVDQLLDVTRITAGRLRLEPELVDLAELVRDVVARFADTSAKVRSPIAVTAETDVRGCWDRTRIDQVVTNLIANALKYGRGRPVEVELHMDRDAVLRVTDHGIGIGEDIQERIFQKFERAVATREFGGFGLGLWITRQIVEASGGKIDVRSDRDRGAVFTVRLPLEQRLPCAEEKTHAGQEPTPSHR